MLSWFCLSGFDRLDYNAAWETRKSPGINLRWKRISVISAVVNYILMRYLALSDIFLLYLLVWLNYYRDVLKLLIFLVFPILNYVFTLYPFTVVSSNLSFSPGNISSEFRIAVMEMGFIGTEYTGLEERGRGCEKVLLINSLDVSTFKIASCYEFVWLTKHDHQYGMT